MSQELYKMLYSADRLEAAYQKTMSGPKKYKKDAVLFNYLKETNMENLKKELREKAYYPGAFGTLVVHEPKERVIHYPKLRDKIVQCASHEILGELYASVFVRDSYSNQKRKGTHDAVLRIQHNMRFVKWKYGDAWILKMDIRKFYYRIDREVAKELLKKQISGEESDFLKFLYMIIDNSPEEDGVGLPLGNVSSQDIANVVGNEIDQYAIRFLHLKWYTRFADDIVIVVPSKTEAKGALVELSNFIEKRLHLELNEKTKIYPCKQGVRALGYRIYTTHILLQDDTIRHMRSRMAKIDEEVKAGRKSVKKAQQEVDAWLGHARIANAYHVCERIFEPYPYIKFDRDDWHFGQPSPKKRKQLFKGKGRRDISGKRNNP